MSEEINKIKFTSKSKEKRNKRIRIVLICVAAVLLLLVIAILLKVFWGKEPEVVPPVESVSVAEPVSEPESVVPEETVPTMLDYMAEYYAQNPDIAGWVRIKDTLLDYPVMFTPDDEEKYLRTDFDGNYSIAGTPFIDKDCSMDPESDNLIIYGHNMNNGTAFGSLLKYAKQSYWEEHPTIDFSTLYEERSYEIIAAFYDRVYYTHEDVFKFYQFIDAEDEEHFNDAMKNYQEKSLYDTGVTAEYGDSLITLVTCSYHHEYGRFVVVARQTDGEGSGETAESETAESESAE